MELIDVGALVAQFLTVLVVWLVLAKFAWPAILRNIDERREKIESDLRNAEERLETAGERQAEYESKLRGIESEARERMNEAIDEGRRLAEGLQQQAREEAKRIVEQGKRNVELELDKAQTLLEERAVELVIQVSERLMKEKMDDETNRRLVGDFINQAGSQN